MLGDIGLPELQEPSRLSRNNPMTKIMRIGGHNLRDRINIISACRGSVAVNGGPSNWPRQPLRVAGIIFAILIFRKEKCR
jgi:hypothetical protein